MIIAFEGIDGAGKTTTAPLVVAALNKRGLSAVSMDKRSMTVKSAFARQQLDALAARLWGVTHDSRLNAVGELHWVYLNAAFFAGTHHALSVELDHDAIVVIDNWINKFVARIASNGEFKLDELMKLIEPLPQPDMVFMLDVRPRLAAARKLSASDAESGALRSCADADFETYQTIVRAHLLTMAEHLGWTVITPRERTAEQVALEVADLVAAESYKGHLCMGGDSGRG